MIKRQTCSEDSYWLNWKFKRRYV